MNMFLNLAKAALAVVVTPVSLAADLLTLPASSLDPHRGAFDRTARTIKQAGDAFDAAVDVEEAAK